MSEQTTIRKRKNPRPLLVGIIIDASSSMSRNWRNKGGKKLPKIEIIRDSLNDQFKKISTLYGQNGVNVPTVHVFCLGMGFVLPQKFIFVQTEAGKEAFLEEPPVHTKSDVICDLIALSEMVPSKALLERVRLNLNKRWVKYSKSILNHASIEEDVFQSLQMYIRENLRATAMSRLDKGWRIYIKHLLERSSLSRFKIARDLDTSLDKNIQRWKDRILTKSDDEANRFFNDIKKHADNIFQTNQRQYADFITETTKGFAEHQCQTILELLTLGYSYNDALNTFDEKKALELAKTIYKKLDQDVRKSIAIAWNINKINLRATEKGLRSSLDHQQVKKLTEQCIQKQGWSILRPFVEQVVTDLFVISFEEQAKKMIPYWLRIAERREIIRPLKRISNLLPETTEETVYSNEYMFGSTPIDEALERSTHRFLDETNKSKQKILLIISDGEYASKRPIILADMLKSRGVTIICCYISSKNVVSQLLTKHGSHWSTGAQNLFKMASTTLDSPEITMQLAENDIEIPDNAKLFIQVNHSEILGKLVDALIITNRIK